MKNHCCDHTHLFYVTNTMRRAEMRNDHATNDTLRHFLLPDSDKNFHKTQENMTIFSEVQHFINSFS